MGYSLGCRLFFIRVGHSVGTRDQTNEGKMGGFCVHFKVSSAGYSFEPRGLSIAPKTLANFLERKTQLYEQGADGKRIGQYALFKFLSPKLRHQPNLFALGNKLGW